MVISVSAVLSSTGIRNVLPDPRSTPSNTQWPLRGCPLWNLRRSNLLSSISTVVLVPPSLTEQPPKKHQHGFPAEHAPVCDGMWTHAIFALDLGGSFAAHGVVCNEQNLLEDEITLLEPRPLLDGRRLIAPDPSNPPATPPTKSLRNIGSCGSCHISTAGITQRRTPKQADVL